MSLITERLNRSFKLLEYPQANSARLIEHDGKRAKYRKKRLTTRCVYLQWIEGTYGIFDDFELLESSETLPSTAAGWATIQSEL